MLVPLIWKICSSNWIISPKGSGWTFQQNAWNLPTTYSYKPLTFQKMCFIKQVPKKHMMIYEVTLLDSGICTWKNPWGVHVTPAPRVYVQPPRIHNDAGLKEAPGPFQQHLRHRGPLFSIESCLVKRDAYDGFFWHPHWVGKIPYNIP